MNPRDSWMSRMNGPVAIVKRSGVPRRVGRIMGLFTSPGRYWGSRGSGSPRASRPHAYLWLRFANAGHPDMQLVGRRLQDLRGLGTRPITTWQIPSTSGWRSIPSPLANDLIQLLEAAAALPAVVTQLTAAIRDYERDVLRQVTWQA